MRTYAREWLDQTPVPVGAFVTLALAMDFPPGIHALIAFRNLHRCTGVLDDSGQAVQE